MVPGCGEVAKPAPTVAASLTANQPSGGESKQRPTGILGQRDLVKVRLEMKQIGEVILAEFLVRGKGPARVEDLKEHMRDAIKYYQALEAGTYKLVPNAPLNGNSVLLYEGGSDREGNRVVVYGDGRVEGMTAEEFAKFEASMTK
jgi:hypothetical protein